MSQPTAHPAHSPARATSRSGTRSLSAPRAASGQPERRPLRAGPRAGVQRPSLGRRGRAPPHARPQRLRHRPAWSRTGGCPGRRIRPRDRRRRPARADRRARPRSAGAGRPVVGRQRRAGARLAPSGGRPRYRVRRRRRHRAGRLVSLVGGLPDRDDPAAPRPPHAGRARGPDEGAAAALQRARHRRVPALFPHASRRHHRAAAAARPPSGHRALAVGEPAVGALADAEGADAPAPGRQRRRQAHGRASGARRPRHWPRPPRCSRCGSRPATTTCTSNSPSGSPTSWTRPCATASSPERAEAPREGSTHPRVHGLRRDGADDGHPASRHRGPAG